MEHWPIQSTLHRHSRQPLLNSIYIYLPVSNSPTCPKQKSTTSAPPLRGLPRDVQPGHQVIDQRLIMQDWKSRYEELEVPLLLKGLRVKRPVTHVSVWLLLKVPSAVSYSILERTCFTYAQMIAIRCRIPYSVIKYHIPKISKGMDQSKRCKRYPKSVSDWTPQMGIAGCPGHDENPQPR